nr:hypothetical protein [Halomonas elongata]
MRSATNACACGWPNPALRAPRDERHAGTLLEPDADALRIACGDGVLRVTRAQLPGGKPLDVAELLRARADRFTVGTRLGTPDRERSA